MKKIVKFFTDLMNKIHLDDGNQKAMERYLSKSVDHIDLENRMRVFERNYFNGNLKF